ncbi:MAG: DUF2905 domain-containing protein [Cytophagaceae bacterium]|nr:DUF2905 domain-containing protein [Cytophagaceae bacterium]MBK9508303.1 DUF2905 domain-containing protein [Cytophagaceae bacterium]MBK9933998.1 DUF2905 domain-containing protein [Cytophagaceae bacterium]MBL0300455.1 DUF2905 domain-containing protein [Cytophagaceae bacterium]MBL0327389.1 DUF2905 domain-containing protein [Cytophagaceae bacterium]
MNPQTGKYLIIIGIVIILAGVIIFFGGNRLNWLGKLPGDIRIEKENFKFYFPFTTLILLSGILNLIIWIFKKYF